MTKINIEDVKTGGAYLIEETMIWSGNWEEKYHEKNIRFFDLLIKKEYDELILAIDKGNNHPYYDLVVIKKGDSDIVLPVPVVMETLHYGDGYDKWKEFYTDVAVVWEDEDEDSETGIDFRKFNRTISRKSYYLNKEYKDNKKKINIITKLLKEGYVELPESYRADDELFNIISFNFDNDDNWDGEITISTKIKKDWGGGEYTNHLEFSELIAIIEEAY